MSSSGAVWCLRGFVRGGGRRHGLEGQETRVSVARPKARRRNRNGPETDGGCRGGGMTHSVGDRAGAPSRVLVVDDSATMRRLLRARLEADARITVVGEAANVMQAREKIKQLSPDVITLDIEMPGMDGIEFLRKIMRLRPLPVVMVAGSRLGDQAVVEALAIGAVDCITKPLPGQHGVAFAGLPEVLLAAARAGAVSCHLRPVVSAPSALPAGRPCPAAEGKGSPQRIRPEQHSLQRSLAGRSSGPAPTPPNPAPRPHAPPQTHHPQTHVVMQSASGKAANGHGASCSVRPGFVQTTPQPSGSGSPLGALPPDLLASTNANAARVPGAMPVGLQKAGAQKIVLIGASTGGGEALQTVLAGLPADCPPILITQHMPESFLARFAERLNARVRPHVLLAGAGAALLPGRVYLAPGGDHHLCLSAYDPAHCHLVAADPLGGYRPSVDVMFLSALPLASRVIAVLLSGMGRDGAQGMVQLRAAGARSLVQDRESSVVYGMARAAVERAAAEQVLPVAEIAPALLHLCAEGPCPPSRAPPVIHRRTPEGQVHVPQTAGLRQAAGGGPQGGQLRPRARNTLGI